MDVLNDAIPVNQKSSLTNFTVRTDSENHTKIDARSLYGELGLVRRKFRLEPENRCLKVTRVDSYGDKKRRNNVQYIPFDSTAIPDIEPIGSELVRILENGDSHINTGSMRVRDYAFETHYFPPEQVQSADKRRLEALSDDSSSHTNNLQSIDPNPLKNSSKQPKQIGHDLVTMIRFERSEGKFSATSQHHHPDTSIVTEYIYNSDKENLIITSDGDETIKQINSDGTVNLPDGEIGDRIISESETNITMPVYIWHHTFSLLSNLDVSWDHKAPV